MSSRRWLSPCGLVLLVFVAYLPALRGDFTFSDEYALVDNPRLRSVGGLRRIWLPSRADRYHKQDQYQPLMYTSYWLERRVWGLNPFGYHLVNVALHAAGAVLVWLLLRKIGVRGAVVAAMLFALHPVNVESVAWIYERKNVLSGLFYFLTFVALFRFDDGRRRHWYGIALLFFATALLTKASTVVLPAVLLLYWWWRGTLWKWRSMVVIAPFFVLAGLMTVLTVFYERCYTGASGVEFSAGLAERLARAGWIGAFYLGKFFVPYNLMLFYPRWSVDPANVLSYLPHALLLIALIVLLAKRRTWARPVLLGLGWYLMALFPTLGFFDIYYQRFSFVADRFQYLAIVGLSGLCVHVAACGFDRLELAVSSATAGKVRLCRGALGILVVAVCGFLTWQRAGVYRSSQTLCEDTLRRNPDCWIAHQKLGEFLSRDQDSRERLALALSHHKRALELRPQEEYVLESVGTTLLLLGRPNQALDYLRRALAANPDNAMFHINLGSALVASSRIDWGIQHLHKAVRLRPDLVDAQLALGEALCRAGRHYEGVVYLREAIRLDPDNRRAAVALAKAGLSR